MRSTQDDSLEESLEESPEDSPEESPSPGFLMFELLALLRHTEAAQMRQTERGEGLPTAEVWAAHRCALKAWARVERLLDESGAGDGPARRPSHPPSRPRARPGTPREPEGRGPNPWILS